MRYREPDWMWTDTVRINRFSGDGLRFHYGDQPARWSSFSKDQPDAGMPPIAPHRHTGEVTRYYRAFQFFVHAYLVNGRLEGELIRTKRPL